MDNNKKLFEGLLKADGINPAGAAESERIAFGKMLDQQSKSKQSKPGSRPDIWRILMKSRITKFAAAAVIAIAAVLSVSIFFKSVPTAFGIEQVIVAYNNIRFLHVKRVRPNQQEPDEFWIKSDELGRVAKARYYLPVTEDGVKLITWTPERAEIWFKSKHGFLILQTKRIEGWMQSIVEQCQPKLVMQKLLEDQKTGKVDIDIQKPAIIVATYKTEPKKEIYYIDQATDLITHIELYSIENNREVLKSTTEFFNYNVPIDEKMFSLKDEVPKEVSVVNQLDQLIGIPQGNMTDEQAAAETVRQFFQALIDKDYKKAGSIFSGISEEEAKKYFSKLNVTAIISIGSPTPHPETGPHSFRVPCKLEITTPDGKKTTWEPYGPFARCGDDEMHPDRWIIHGGI
jgi:hypothetical protein